MQMERKVTELAIEDILPNRFQPRIKFNEVALNDLAVSIKEHGVIQPIVVRRIGDKFEIIAGERRYKASILANKMTIPAIVTDLDDKESAEVALIENVQRQDLTPIEEAVSYKKILDMGYLTQEQLAEKLGRTQSTIANKLRLLNLVEDVQEALLDHKISERHARSLLRIADPRKQNELLNQIMRERLTVRRTDEVIAEALMETESPASLQESPEIAPLPPLLPSQPLVSEEPKQDYSNVEVLDFEDKKENEGDMMNQDQTTNPYNFPMEPIVDDLAEEASLLSSVATPDFADIEPITIDEPEIVPNVASPISSPNPGFMDVDQIATTAQDIYQPKPPVDLTNLLEPSGFTPDPTPILVEPPAPVAPVATPEVISEPEDSSAPRAGKFFNLFGAQVAQTPIEKEKFVSNLEDKSANMDFGMDEKPVQAPTNAFQFDQLFNPMKPSVLPEATIAPEIKPEPVAMDILEPANLSQTDFAAPSNFSMPQMPIFEDQPKAQNNFALDPEAVLPITGSRVAEPPRAVASLATVIGLIRNCSDEIERLGYSIDAEEADFERTYQVTFRIDKK